MSKIDVQKEITEIKKDISDIKETQEVDIQRNRHLYEEHIRNYMRANYAYVYVKVDGLKSQKEITAILSDTISQPTVSRAIKHLLRYGLIKSLEETKNGSPIYGKPRWAKILQMDEYVRLNYISEHIE